MKKLFALTLLCFITCIIRAQDYKQLDTLLETLSTNTKLMGNLSIIKNGKSVYNKSVGYSRFLKDDKKMKN